MILFACAAPGAHDDSLVHSGGADSPTESGGETGDTRADTADHTDDGSGGVETGDTARDSAGETGPVDTGDPPLEGHPVSLVVDGLEDVRDALRVADGSVFLSGAGPSGWGVYRWDGGLELRYAHEDAGPLIEGTDGTVYVSTGADILAVPTGTSVPGAAAYAPGAMDLLSTEQGDRLTFPGTDPRTAATAVYTVRVNGGTVAVVGEGYTAPLVAVFRPGGETTWAVDELGSLWLVPEGEDLAVEVLTGVPTGGLTGTPDGAVLYLAGERSMWTYDVAAEVLTEVPLAMAAGEVVSLHRSPDGTTGLLGVDLGADAAVMELTFP